MKSVNIQMNEQKEDARKPSLGTHCRFLLPDINLDVATRTVAAEEKISVAERG